ncbi:MULTISPECIES: GlxA family transcriptional regulator [Methylobacterium]|uniref:HTH-type transcriptional regulator CdhR n=1 Tax=Methylobacterium thuringiense TaxID=1003091 RepID=A0ABQ4TS09_9HYPH|nr:MULTISPECIES: GlxA family transcriptional regulator [Methylobacterium]TXN22063.1 GlxA family transcriptional regulator [Methylobacterium sp. WL9]GJE57453.1 HTH-type transcriptional regulator CdhR [Methylobacterium thuringiense]
MASRSIAVLALPGVQLLDVAGPLDVFAEANAQSGQDVYDLAIVGMEPGPVITSSGRGLVVDLVAPGAAPTCFDTLLVAGAPRIQDLEVRPDLLAWLGRTALHCRRYGSVCSGAFLLGQAGLLNGRRVTTHWAVAEALAERYPEAIVQPDAICLFDGALRTAAGVTAGLDLALALVEEDLGAEIARRVAAQLVMFFKRGGGQMQFSRRGVSAPVGRSALQEVQRWVAARPAEDHGVDRLAERAGMSPRHFARLFRAETGLTPAAYVENVRIEAVRRLLEAEGAALKQVAGACGFRDADTLRRAFVRRVGTTPAEYRRRQART